MCFQITQANVQGLTGFCSTQCSVDTDCTPHDHCVMIASQGAFCVRACKVDTDCYDAFVCRGSPFGDKHNYCLWDPA